MPTIGTVHDIIRRWKRMTGRAFFHIYACTCTVHGLAFFPLSYNIT